MIFPVVSPRLANLRFYWIEAPRFAICSKNRVKNDQPSEPAIIFVARAIENDKAVCALVKRRPIPIQFRHKRHLYTGSKKASITVVYRVWLNRHPGASHRGGANRVRRDETEWQYFFI
jgi:hypothetical protein